MKYSVHVVGSSFIYCFVRLLLSAAVKLLLMNVEFGTVAENKHV